MGLDIKSDGHLEFTFRVTSEDKEIQAMEVIVVLMRHLSPEEIERVLTWASSRFKRED